MYRLMKLVGGCDRRQRATSVLTLMRLPSLVLMLLCGLPQLLVPVHPWGLQPLPPPEALLRLPGPLQASCRGLTSPQ